MIKKTLFLVSMLAFTSLANAVYIGGSIGYLTDMEEDYETGRIGLTFAQQGNTNHNVELEVGHGYDSSGWTEVRIVPVVLNYRGETDLGKSVFVYYGAGAGVAYVRGELRFDNRVYTGTDNSFVFQGFGGLGYRVNEKFSILGGGRYLRITDIDSVGSENDFGVNLGVQISF